MTWLVAALIGLGTILTALTFVWMLSLLLSGSERGGRLLGSGFRHAGVAVLPPVAGVDAAVLSRRRPDHAMGTRLSAHIFHRHQVVFSAVVRRIALEGAQREHSLENRCVSANVTDRGPWAHGAVFRTANRTVPHVLY